MSRHRWALACSAVAVLAFLACDDEHRRTAPGQVFGGGRCEALPGQLPAPDCDSSERACSAGQSCTIAASCGATATCLPLADNTGRDVLDLRIRRLNIASPAVLAGAFIQSTVVNGNLDLAAPQCAESGTGLFSWILRLDMRMNLLTTGGAPPALDPFGKGFCFADLTIGATKISPITTRIERSGNTFRTLEQRDVNIPIYSTPDPASALILPISAARIEGATLSADGNCIGRFNPAALDSACTEDRALCSKWATGGALGGFITLENAEKVTIRELGNRSICAYLAAESTPTCARDASGRITFRGDYCSVDHAAGSCADSVWLAATFAASAVTIGSCE